MVEHELSPEPGGSESSNSSAVLALGTGVISSHHLLNAAGLVDPHCFGLTELPDASRIRAQVSAILRARHGKVQPITWSSRASGSSPQSAAFANDIPLFENETLFAHLAYGLAYTAGSALGAIPPTLETCLAAYVVPNSAGLTAGSRAWSKHSHRSQPAPSDEAEHDKRKRSAGWWGVTRGPVAIINENSLALFWKVMNSATWRNLHLLPHQVLVYEVRVPEGYGMRWSRQADREGDDSPKERHAWMFRGFLEPTMENGHELRWRHPLPSKD